MESNKRGAHPTRVHWSEVRAHDPRELSMGETTSNSACDVLRMSEWTTRPVSSAARSRTVVTRQASRRKRVKRTRVEKEKGTDRAGRKGCVRGGEGGPEVRANTRVWEEEDLQ
eukprot:5002174-Pleurochrysis_carterae.AAC.1